MAKSKVENRLLRASEAQFLLGVGLTTLYKFRKEGKLNPIKFSSRGVRYRLSEIQALIVGADSKEGQ